MFKSSNNIGKLGEDLACEYLVKKSYKILARNYRKKWGEIDIISRASDKTLIFVEVKTLAGDGELSPEDNLTAAKLKKTKRACEAFALHNQDLINGKKGWRIDLIAITLGNGDRPEIRHYENI